MSQQIQEKDEQSHNVFNEIIIGIFFFFVLQFKIIMKKKLDLLHTIQCDEIVHFIPTSKTGESKTFVTDRTSWCVMSCVQTRKGRLSPPLTVSLLCTHPIWPVTRDDDVTRTVFPSLFHHQILIITAIEPNVFFFLSFLHIHPQQLLPTYHVHLYYSKPSKS